MNKELLIAHAAGILDGEGCFGIRYEKKYNSYLPAIQVVMTTAVPLRRLVGLFGGSITRTASNDPAHSPVFHYTALGRNARALVAATSKYLLEKHDQAQCMIDLQANIDEWNQKSRLRGNLPPAVMEYRRSLKERISTLKSVLPSQEIGCFPAWKREELAYLAGVLEAEGCFTIVRGDGNSFAAVVSVQMCCNGVLLRLQKAFGGTIIPVKIRLGRKPKFMWRVKGRSAADLCRSTAPYLTFKTEEADILRTLQNTVDLYGKRAGRAGLPPEIVEKRVQLMGRIQAIHRHARAETNSEQPTT